MVIAVASSFIIFEMLLREHAVFNWTGCGLGELALDGRLRTEAIECAGEGM